MPRSKPVMTPEAMKAAGITNPATFRKAMLRERQKGRDYRLPRDQWLDGRTPLWDEQALKAWAAGRPERAEKKETP